MVLAAAGGVQHEKLVKLADSYLGSLPNVYSEGQPPVPARCRFTGMNKTTNQNILDQIFNSSSYF